MQASANGSVAAFAVPCSLVQSSASGAVVGAQRSSVRAADVRRPNQPLQSASKFQFVPKARSLRFRSNIFVTASRPTPRSQPASPAPMDLQCSSSASASSSKLVELTVGLGARSYPIYIGSNILSDTKRAAEMLRKHVKGKTCLIVTNTTVGPLYLQKVVDTLRADGTLKVETVELPDGEEYKTLQVLDQIFTACLEKRLDRRTTLVALGGGVVGDMTGFAAAAYQRGVKFIQVPTTLLAMVDSSVGGKTGVNHPLGKNMIGAFHQPQCVLVDTSSLNTLPDRELSAGIAEVIKYSFINDLPFLDWLEANMDKLLQRDPEALAYAVERSCRRKAEIVEADETESTGMRALLNLGHTFGHAIENGMGYGEWLHGEAVAAGMCMAARMSAKLGWIAQADVDRATAIVERARLPTRPPQELSVEQFLAAMSVDKKVADGQLSLVLMRALGESVLTKEYTQEQLVATLQAELPK
eukprot:tig00021127_g18826.t1